MLSLRKIKYWHLSLELDEENPESVLEIAGLPFNKT